MKIDFADPKGARESDSKFAI